jgi:hypothetical protein
MQLLCNLMILLWMHPSEGENGVMILQGAIQAKMYLLLYSANRKKYAMHFCVSTTGNRRPTTCKRQTSMIKKHLGGQIFENLPKRESQLKSLNLQGFTHHAAPTSSHYTGRQATFRPYQFSSYNLKTIRGRRGKSVEQL